MTATADQCDTTGASPAGVVMAGLLDRFSGLLDEFAGLDWTGLSDTEAEAGLREFVTQVRRCSAVRHRLVHETAVRALPEQRHFRSYGPYARDLLRVTVGEGKAWLDQARMCTERVPVSGGEPLPPRCPETAAALAAGQISDRHVAVICHAIERTPSTVPAGEVAEGEQILARAAADLDPQQLVKVAQRWLDRVDPDGALGSDRAERDRARCLRLSRQDKHGMTSIKGLLDPETAEAVKAALSPLAAPRHTPEGPDGEPAVRDERTSEQRLHDALRDGCRRLLGSDTLPVSHGVHTKVFVTIDLAQLEARTGIVSTANGGTVTVEDLTRHAAHTGHIPIVLNGKGKPLHFGAEQRLATEDQRLLMIALDEGCTWPGCTVPPAWCEAAHCTPYRTSKRTSVDDMALLCGYHHHYADTHHWTIKRTNGRIWITPPDWIDPQQRPRTNEYFKIKLE